MDVTTRRKFLLAGLGTVAVAASGGVFYPLFRYLAPRSSVTASHKVDIKAIDVPEGGAKYFEYNGSSAVLIRKKGGDLIALSAVCTHLGCIVQWQKENEKFLCPCHAGLYTADGTVVSGPPPKPLARLPFTVANGIITVG